MAILKIKSLGNDSWNRPTYITESGGIVKNTDLTNEPTVYNLYTSSNFDGEPDLPIRKDFKIIVVEKF